MRGCWSRCWTGWSESRASSRGWLVRPTCLPHGFSRRARTASMRGDPALPASGASGSIDSHGIHRPIANLKPGQQLVGRGPTAVTMEVAADRVWAMRGGFPIRAMNVYFIEEDGGGVTGFDAGIEVMTQHVVEVGRILGGISRILPGHSHCDHRGAAAGAGAPVWCHEAERADAEGDGGLHYMHPDRVPRFVRGRPARLVYPHLMKMWDGGPVKV